jgi:hypothetical protein
VRALPQSGREEAVTKLTAIIAVEVASRAQPPGDA